MNARILFGVRKGAEDWEEELLTEMPEQFESAKAWAITVGFNPAKFREAVIDLSTPPDFAKTVNK